MATNLEIFNEVLEERKIKLELFKEVEKEIPTYVRDFIKSQVKTISVQDVLSLIKRELSEFKAPVVEKVIEKEIIKKDTRESDKELRDYSENLVKKLEKVFQEKLDKEIDTIYERIRRTMASAPRYIPPMVPNFSQSRGKYLTTDGDQMSWANLSGGAGSDPFYIGDPNVNGSWRFITDGNNLSVQKLVSGTWTETFAFTPNQ